MRTRELGRAANATLARMTVRTRARDLRHCPLAAARAGDLTGGARDGTPQGLDRGCRQSRTEAGDADRRLGTAVSAEDWAADADDALGRLLEIDRVPAPAHGGELALEARHGRDRILRPGRERPGVQAVDLLIRNEREH